MTGPQRVCRRVLGTLEMAIMRFYMGEDYYSDQDFYILGEELNKLNLKRLLNVVDKNHVAYLTGKKSKFPESVYEIVHDKKLAKKGTHARSKKTGA